MDYVAALKSLHLDDMISIIYLMNNDAKLDLFIMGSLIRAENRSELEGIFIQYIIQIQLDRPNFIEEIKEIAFLIKNYRLLRLLGGMITSSNIISAIDKTKKQLYLIADKMTRADMILVIAHFDCADVDEHCYFEEVLCRWQVNGVISDGLALDSSAWTTMQTIISKKILPNISISTAQENDFYPIYDDNELGFCIVINNSSFTSNAELSHLMPKSPLAPRHGSERDVEAVVQTFTNLKFVVHHHENVNFSNLKMLISSYSKAVADYHSFFVLVFMSHGLEGVVYTADSVAVSLDALDNSFQRNSCPKLAGKPKIFIVQACQGSDLQRIMLDGESIIPNSIQGSFHCPEKGDSIIAWSTVKGYASFRDMFEGSWFIQDLCKELSNPNNIKDFVEIVTKVNNNLRTKSHNGVIMVPSLVSSLCKKINFFRKIQ